MIDPRTRLLLFRFDNGRDGASWLTPGGGIHRGETIEAAAVRELAEETGYVVAEADLGPVIATRGGIWRADRSGRLVFGADTFFLVRVAHSAVSTDGHEELERSIITGHRWWTVGELRSTRERVSPPGVADLVASLLADGVPARPVRLRGAPPAERGERADRAARLRDELARREPSGAAWKTGASGPRSRTAARSPGSGSAASLTRAAASSRSAPLETAIATASRSADSCSDGRATAAAV